MVFATAAGFVGYGPLQTRIGDQVVLPFDGHAPILLTPVSATAWKFLGFAYVGYVKDVLVL